MQSEGEFCDVPQSYRILYSVLQVYRVAWPQYDNTILLICEKVVLESVLCKHIIWQSVSDIKVFSSEYDSKTMHIELRNLHSFVVCS